MAQHCCDSSLLVHHDHAMLLYSICQGHARPEQCSLGQLDLPSSNLDDQGLIKSLCSAMHIDCAQTDPIAFPHLGSWNVDIN